MVRQRYRNSVKSSCSYPGADIDSDHNLVAMRVQIKLKKIKKCAGRKRWNVTKLKTNKVAFRKVVEEQLEYEAGMSVEKKWKKIKETILESD